MRLRNADLAWQELDGTVVILDLRASRYLEVNLSGSLLFHQLVDGTSDAQLVERLRDRYGISPEAARRDVDEFVALLRSRDLLED